MKGDEKQRKQNESGLETRGGEMNLATKVVMNWPGHGARCFPILYAIKFLIENVFITCELRY